jgi:hypothetical protein
MIADTEEKIEMMRLLTIRSGLKLELLGMRHSRNAAFKAAKQITGKRTRREALESLEDLIRSKKLNVSPLSGGLIPFYLPLRAGRRE